MEIKNMEIKNMESKEEWENFLLNCEEKTFLQSWNWGEFNKIMGNKIWRLGIYERMPNDNPVRNRVSNGVKCQISNLIAVVLVVKVVAKRGTFLSAPHAPVVKFQISDLRSKVLETLLNKLKEIAKEERCSFIRLSPIWERNSDNLKIFKDLGFIDSPIFLHPDLTWELNLSLSEEGILSEMRKTTRYLIRQAQKNKDIEIIISQKTEDIEGFNKLYQETVNRQHFIPYSLDYLKKEFLVFSPDKQIAIFLGKYKGEIVSMALVVFWQDGAYYHHGATSFKYSKIPVSYLVQWEAFKEAKKRGCGRYNFWGIAPENNPNHPWQGFTLFKKGFGGYKKEYVKTQDFPLSKRYWFTYVFEKLRKIKRGL